MEKKPNPEQNLVNERDIDENFGLFVEDSYPDSIPLPPGIKHERPDGTRPGDS